MEIKKSDHIAFGYTVKDNRKPEEVTEASYAPFFDRLEKFSVKVEYKVKELDKRGRIHYHGIIYLKKGFFRRKICVKGLHIKLEEIYDKAGWTKYIHKDCEFHKLEEQAKSRKRLKVKMFS